MNPVYKCVYGHTFDRPMTRNDLGMVNFCPICNTADFEKIQDLQCTKSSLQSPVNSSYETWAKKEQPVILGRTVTLGEVVTAIQNYVPIASDVMITGMKTLIENIFGLTSGEMNRLVDGKEYWIC